ncbi:MAG: nitroreductase family protein [Candidatus Nanopelagicales bacterium]
MNTESKIAKTAEPIHELLANRWSPRSLQPEHLITKSEIISLLEAARWAPSSMNKQPWRFLVAFRGDENFNLLQQTLKDTNSIWAPNASTFILVLADQNPLTSQVAFDLGLATSALTLQASAIHLYTHQMAGFDKKLAQELLNLPETLTPVVVIAVGVLADPGLLSDELKERELMPRSRKELSELVVNWDQFTA